MTGTEFGKGDQGCAWTSSQLKNFENIHGIYYKRRNDDFSSKHSFEENSTSYIITMKFFEMKTYFEPPSVPAGIIGHFEDKICETLDLMTEMTLSD